MLDPDGAGAAAVRGAEPRPCGERAGRRPRSAAALGGAARDHARAAVRRRAVAARAPRGDRAASCSARWTSTRAACCGCPTCPICARCSTRCARTASRSSRSATSGASVLDPAQAFMALLEGYAEHVMDAVGADLLDRSRRDARGDGPAPHRALRPAAAAREADRARHEDAPVPAGQGVLRRRRGPRRDRRAEPRVGRAGVPARRPPSSTTRSAGSAGPSRSPPEPLRATGQLRLGRAARDGPRGRIGRWCREMHATKTRHRSRQAVDLASLCRSSTLRGVCVWSHERSNQRSMCYKLDARSPLFHTKWRAGRHKVR